jgi:hypothetical protein
LLQIEVQVLQQVDLIHQHEVCRPEHEWMYRTDHRRYLWLRKEK